MKHEISTNGFGSSNLLRNERFGEPNPFYDDNENLIADTNKDIIDITYNHLNLSNIITFGNGNTITWHYDATGVKLQKQKFEAGLKYYLAFAENRF